MLNKMFLFSKTANKFETAAVAALILGLFTFTAPAVMHVAVTVLAIVALFASFRDKVILKIVLSLLIVFVSVLFLSGTMVFAAISLTGVGIVGVVSLITKFVRAEIQIARELREDEEDNIEDAEVIDESFFEMK